MRKQENKLNNEMQAIEKSSEIKISGNGMKLCKTNVSKLIRNAQKDCKFDLSAPTWKQMKKAANIK